MPKAPSHPSRDSSATFLAPSKNAGIAKKKKLTPLKRKQRIRLEQGKEKAENVQGRIEAKMMGSKGRGERRKARRADWEDIDEKIGREIGAGSKSKTGKKQEPEEDQGLVEHSARGVFDSAENDLTVQENAQSPKMGKAQDTAAALEEDEEIS